ncbi:MAG: ABC transporter ATP-binding protein [Lachnospiraceae bacterium]|nr:ABC transporter ATP-binding protein [Lachnospiraceae bacterium]
MLKVDGIYKKYGKKQVLNNLSFEVPENSIYTLVGAYGDGKTTLLNIIAGFEKADKGNIYIKEVECQKEPSKARKLFGFVPDDFPMYDQLSGKEYLEFFGRIMSDKDDEQIKHLAVNLLGFVGLDKAIDVRIKRYNYHMRQKLSIARALLHNPKFIILDEPFYGLDVKHVKEIKEIIDFLHKQGRTIFMTSDNLNLSASVSTAIGIMENGTMLYGEQVQKAYETLLSKTSMNNMTVRKDMLKERTIYIGNDHKENDEFDFEDTSSEYKINKEITKNPDGQGDLNHTMHRMPDLSQTMHKMPNINQSRHKMQELNHTMHRMPDLSNTMHEMPDLSHTMHRMPDLNQTMHKMPDLSHTMHEMPDLNQTMHRMPDLSHTMHEMPDLNQTMHRMPDLSHTMHEMPDLNQTMHRIPDLSHTMHEMPDLNQTMHRMPDLNHTMHRMPPVEEPIKMPYSEIQKIHNSRTGDDLSNRVVTSNRMNVEKRGAGGSRVVTNKNNIRKKS